MSATHVDLKITIVPSKNSIPDVMYLEENILEGETWGFLSDADGLIYCYTMDHGELLVSEWFEDLAVAILIDEIEGFKEEGFSADPNFDPNSVRTIDLDEEE